MIDCWLSVFLILFIYGCIVAILWAWNREQLPNQVLLLTKEVKDEQSKTRKDTKQTRSDWF